MVLVGVHPVFTHVPPNSLRSTIATFIPASLKRPARDGPACPVPTMIASYSFDIKGPFSLDLLNPLAPPGGRLEGIREILCLAHDLSVAELHNTHWFISTGMPDTSAS